MLSVEHINQGIAWKLKLWSEAEVASTTVRLNCFRLTCTSFRVPSETFKHFTKEPGPKMNHVFLR